MKRASFLGVDPGASGALALLHPMDGVLLLPMPKIGKEIDLAAIADFLREHAPTIRMATVEQVSARPGQGVTSMFSFGRSYGSVLGMLAAFEIPFQLVRPQEWQKTMHAGTPSSSDPKSRSHLAFTRLFPGVDARATERSQKPHEGAVEAALIAEYTRRTIHAL